jgi:signal transduction histidine kinase
MDKPAPGSGGLIGPHDAALHAASGPEGVDEAAWLDVIRKMDEVYSQLVADEIALEQKNEELQRSYEALSEAHEALKRTQQQLLQSEKMASLGRLVAGVAHELNNPISFVAGNVEHLRDYARRLTQMLTAYAAHDADEGSRAQLQKQWRALGIDDVLSDLPGLLADCEEGAQRVRAIVHELRTFARSDERAAWQQVDLRSCLERSLSLLGHRLGSHIIVHRELEGLPEVQCVPGQINQVLTNLLANAIDAIGERPGHLSIRGERQRDSDPPMVYVEICDDGCGIPESVFGRIFEPFFTTKPVGQGTGLGLSVSYGIVQRHNGRIEVESRPGCGTCVRLVLPVAQPQSPGLATPNYGNTEQHGEATESQAGP